MPGRPKRKARLIREGKALPSWNRGSASGSGRAGKKVRLAHRDVKVSRHASTAANHEIIEGHPSQAPAASPGRGSPFCSSSSVKASDIEYHVGGGLGRRHVQKLPARFKPGQVVVTEHSDSDGVGEVFTVIATWCDGGRLKTFIGQEGS